MRPAQRLRLQRGIALGRSRALIVLAGTSVVAACVPLVALALTREPLDMGWAPIAASVALLTLAGLVRPIEPAPGEKFSLAAAASLFGALVLPAPFAVSATASASLAAKLIQRRSALNMVVNVSQASGATAAAALLASSAPAGGVLTTAAAAAGYLVVTLSAVTIMILAAQGPRDAVAFLRREWLPTSALLGIGGIAGLAWSRDPLAILLFIPVLAVVELAVRRAARERAALAAAEAAQRAQRDLALDAAHELRTPLAAIVGELGYVHAASLPPDEAAALAAAHDGARHLGTLVDRLLILARADASAAATGSCDLASVVRRALATAPPPGVTLEATIGPSLPVALPEELAATVVRDLVRNAYAYTPSGRVSVEVARSGDRAVLTVADTGIGVAPEELPRVFDRFYRGARARALAPGAGLGLAIVRRIVESCAGGIAIESRPGRGTTVTVRLPTA